MNNVTLIGRLAAAPEVRYFESGTNVAKFRIAVDRLPRNGEKQEPDWFNCEAWGKLAEVAGNYCEKGKQVALSGRIEFEHWQDKSTGEKRSKPVVKVERLELLGNAQAGSDEVNHAEQIPAAKILVAVASDDGFAVSTQPNGADIPF